MCVRMCVFKVLTRHHAILIANNLGVSVGGFMIARFIHDTGFLLVTKPVEDWKVGEINLIEINKYLGIEP